MAGTTQAITLEGHGGALAVAVARRHGVQAMFTLSGGHVFPLYDGAVKADPPLRLVDVRHEQTAVFAAEGTAKLTRTPGLAVVTAGPGVTNSVSAVTTAWFNGSPLLVLGGRAPQGRWGTGSLQELDHPPLLAPVTKRAATVHQVGEVAAEVDAALRLANQAHRGPVFLDVPIEQLYSTATVPPPTAPPAADREPDADALARVAALLATAERPVLVLGSDVWADHAEHAARRAAEALALPVIANGMGRGVLPSGHQLLVTRARSLAFGTADLVVAAGAPLDFRLGYGVFGGGSGSPPAKVVHLADAPGQLAGHVELAGATAGDLRLVLDGLVGAAARHRASDRGTWLQRLRAAAAEAGERDRELLASDAEPIHPARVYGELRPLLAEDAVVIGDGAAGLSLMDVDTLVRHRLPVVMICGNNGAWGLEKHPMRALYGYDVAADLQRGCRYDEVVRALGGAGELVASPAELGAALRRAFDADVPYLVNVLTDTEVAYPRATTGL